MLISTPVVVVFDKLAYTLMVAFIHRHSPGGSTDLYVTVQWLTAKSVMA